MQFDEVTAGERYEISIEVDNLKSKTRKIKRTGRTRVVERMRQWQSRVVKWSRGEDIELKNLTK